MIRRSLSVLLLAIIALAFPLTARADVIVGPDYNSFYSRNYDKCVYLGRNFYANGSDGHVSLRNRPGALLKGYKVQNGTILHISFTCNFNGEIWGATQIYEPDKHPSQSPSGWMPMNDLLLAYDHISFEESHRDEIYTRLDVYESMPAKRDIVFWAWPGSGEIVHTLEAKWRSSTEHEQNFLSGEKLAYKDFEGREWVFIPYLFGRVNAWVFIDDPDNTDIPVFNPAPAPEPWRPRPEDFGQQISGMQLPVIIAILVALLVLITAVLIRVFWRRKKAG